MSTEDYLINILNQQDLKDSELNILRNFRDKIENHLSTLEGSPRFYYAGSYGKKTIIRERYDLDIVIYWPNSTRYTIEGIYDGVGKRLKEKWQSVSKKNVSWEIRFQGGFHIDVVPGRAIDDSYKEANLYRVDTGTTLKTSIKTHIDTVRNSGRRDVIRLMKLWRERKSVPFKKSFLLEMMTIEGSKGKSLLESQFTSALKHIRDNIETAQVKDPANSNNSLSDDISASDKRRIRSIAESTLNSNWSQAFSK